MISAGPGAVIEGFAPALIDLTVVGRSVIWDLTALQPDRVEEFTISLTMAVGAVGSIAVSVDWSNGGVWTQVGELKTASMTLTRKPGAEKLYIRARVTTAGSSGEVGLLHPGYQLCAR